MLTQLYNLQNISLINNCANQRAENLNSIGLQYCNRFVKLYFILTNWNIVRWPNR